MNKIVLFGFSLISSTFFFAQTPEKHHCAKRDAFANHQMKSASLSVSQIAETEKYDVHFYGLDVAMDNLSTDIGGTGEIHASARETLDSALFELHSNFTISDIRVNGSTVTYSRVGSAIKVPVNASQGQSFAIAIDYDGTPPTAGTNPFGGAGMSNDSSPTWGNQVTWSLSEPFSAYEWWPCKQSLRDKADSCAIKITVPNACKAGSNGVLENTVDLGNGTTRYEWKHRHPIDYYLISIAVAEYVEYNTFANVPGAPNPILIQNFIYDNPGTLTNFQSDIDETNDFMILFSDLFGLYPFHDEKYGHCMAPLGGGMEHQTMTTQGYFVKWLTAHELGHQWWGNSVTCASWADIWVNEGFASYSEYLMLENLYPNEKDQDMIDRHNNIMSSPGGSTWVVDSLNEGRIFSGRLTYDKGAAIVHTFRFIMNNDTQFFDALKDIQIDFKDSTAIGLDIKEAFEDASGVDYTDAFQEWYFGEGFPIYSARWNTVGSDLLLELSHTTSASTPTFTNPLEVRFSRSGAADTIIRFDINDNLEQFVLSGMGNVINVSSIDPNNWIINQVGTIQNDPDFTVGIAENEFTNDYKIHPNPSSGEFHISTEMNGDHRYQLFDTKGKMIQHGTFNQLMTINLSDAKNGYYLMYLTDANGNTRVRTLVKN